MCLLFIFLLLVIMRRRSRRDGRIPPSGPLNDERAAAFRRSQRGFSLAGRLVDRLRRHVRRRSRSGVRDGRSGEPARNGKCPSVSARAPVRRLAPPTPFSTLRPARHPHLAREWRGRSLPEPGLSPWLRGKDGMPRGVDCHGLNVGVTSLPIRCGESATGVSGGPEDSTERCVIRAVAGPQYTP